MYRYSQSRTNSSATSSIRCLLRCLLGAVFQVGAAVAHDAGAVVDDVIARTPVPDRPAAAGQSHVALPEVAAERLQSAGGSALPQVLPVAVRTENALREYCAVHEHVHYLSL